MVPHRPIIKEDDSSSDRLLAVFILVFASFTSLTLPNLGSIIRPPFRFGHFAGYGAVW